MLKITTFNIRCDCRLDGENNFEYRKPFILEKLERARPDIICFQEVLPHVACWLKAALTGYYVIGCGRDEALEGEQMTVAYRKENINLISMETFWLSPTPCVPGSRYEEQSPCPRVCTEAVFEDLSAKHVFRLVNLHLDHMGAMARILGLEQIIKKVEGADAFGGAPVILTGDFNAQPWDPELAQMNRRPGYRLITEQIGITYHGYTPEDTPGSIDHFYLRDGDICRLRVHSLEKWEDRKGVLWLSDHYPVCATLSFEKYK